MGIEGPSLHSSSGRIFRLFAVRCVSGYPPGVSPVKRSTYASRRAEGPYRAHRGDAF